MPHSNTTLNWQNGQPYSKRFDDVYFSTDDGLAETEYVFLQGNQLNSRWQQWHTDFTIIETGFGTGLNLCAAAKLWQSCIQSSNQVLRYFSIEKYPLLPQELAQALSAWPELETISTALITSYRKANFNSSDATVLSISPNIQLILSIGDVKAQLPKCNQIADAWFLDGFSPAKNPEMWQAMMFTEMARLSRNGTTLSTFTTAGMVKRGLIEAGFSLQKKPGFGKKREMLTGEW